MYTKEKKKKKKKIHDFRMLHEGLYLDNKSTPHSDKPAIIEFISLDEMLGSVG